jgi:hypothetical protein
LGGTRSNAAGVSWATKTACTAVGSYQGAAGHEHVLIERWNGTG